MGENSPLDNPVILDTEGDVLSRIHIVCRACGTEVDISDIRSREDGGIDVYMVCIVCEEFLRQKTPPL